MRIPSLAILLASLFALSLLNPLAGADDSDDASDATDWAPLAASPAAAAVWGMGGNADHLVISTISNGVLYSHNDGLEWHGASGATVSEGRLAADPTDPDRIFHAGFGGIDRTLDGGETWTNVLDPGYVQRIATAPDGRVIAATRGADGPDVYLSSDHGETWTAIDGPLPNFSAAYGVAFGPGPDDLVVMSIGDTYASHDGGATWSETGPGNRALAQAPDGTLWQSGSSGTLRSTDAGRTWDPVTVPSGSPTVLAIADDGTIFGASGAGVVRSTDNGATWVDMGFGDIAFAATALVPDTTTPGAVWMADENIGVSRVFPAGDGFAIETRTNGFPPVEVTALGAAPDGSVLLAGGQLGLFASRDGGTTWSHTGAGLGFPFMTAAAAGPGGDFLLAGGRNWINQAYLQVSRDGGLTWDTQLPNQNDSGIGAIAVDPEDPTRAWVALHVDLTDSHLLETTDAGQTWTSIFTLPRHIDDVAYDATTGILHVATGLGVFTGAPGTPAFVPTMVNPLGSRYLDLAGDTLVAEGPGLSLWRSEAGVPVMLPWADAGALRGVAAHPDGQTAWTIGGGGRLARCDGAGPAAGACVPDAPAPAVGAVLTHEASGRVYVGTGADGIFVASL